MHILSLASSRRLLYLPKLAKICLCVERKWDFVVVVVRQSLRILTVWVQLVIQVEARGVVFDHDVLLWDKEVVFVLMVGYLWSMESVLAPKCESILKEIWLDTVA